MMIIVASYAFSVFSSQPIEWMSRLFVGSSSSKHVGAREQRLREQHAQLEAGWHFAHRELVLRFVDARVYQDRPRACLGGIAVVLGDLRLQFRGLHVVDVGRVRVRVDAIALMHRVPELDVALHHDVQDALILVTELVLVELAHAQPGLQHDVARARLQLATEDLHERRFAAAVRADEAVAVAVRKLDRDVLEQAAWLRTGSKDWSWRAWLPGRTKSGGPAIAGRAVYLTRRGVTASDESGVDTAIRYDHQPVITFPRVSSDSGAPSDAAEHPHPVVRDRDRPADCRGIPSMLRSRRCSSGFSVCRTRFWPLSGAEAAGLVGFPDWPQPLAEHSQRSLV
jgi:hypothetical protein